MNRTLAWIFRVVNALIVCALVACVCVPTIAPAPALAILGCWVLAICIRPAPYGERTRQPRIRSCRNACELLIVFLVSTALLIVAGCLALCWPAPGGVPGTFWETVSWAPGLGVALATETLVFWCGMVRAYARSVQLGLRLRVLGGIFGMVPLVHLHFLLKIISTLDAEARFEYERERLNEGRRQQRVCATRYPILLVHGVFFRDFKLVNYWGRIPAELELNGARLFYGEHSSALPVHESARELSLRIREVCERTGAEKVNLIGHSKGGLDCRAALADPQVKAHVASLTTINTPHRGCEFADYLLNVMSNEQQQAIARSYNAAAHALGDPAPNFIAAVGDLTASGTALLNKELPQTIEGVWCASIGSRLNGAASGTFPLNFTYFLARRFDGPNDGLVGERSFAWGNSYRFLTVEGRRGISHGDVVDLNRENIPGFDVREFYVQLVADLKARGL